jgi:hypothetical protein
MAGFVAQMVKNATLSAEEIGMATRATVGIANGRLLLNLPGADVTAIGNDVSANVVVLGNIVTAHGISASNDLVNWLVGALAAFDTVAISILEKVAIAALAGAL